MRIMKVAYYLNLGSLNVGVVQKILVKIKYWKKFGCDVKLFLLTRDLKLVEFVTRENCSYCSGVYGNYFGRVFQEHKIIKNILRYNPDLVYYRFGGYLPLIYNLLKQLPSIAEINSSIDEYKIFSFIKYLYVKFTQKILYRYSKGFVFVTKELMKNACLAVDKNSIVISNGIDLSMCESLDVSLDKMPAMIFVGSADCAWYGIDKIFTLATLMPDCRFDLIGNLSVPPMVKLPSNIFMHGFVKSDSEKYKEIMRNADVGLGSLALHRNRMDEACALKVRDYLAHGLPVIIGYRDGDFFNQEPFILNLPNTEDNVVANVELIKKFINKWKGKRVPRRDILHLDIAYKEAQRMDFFKKICAISKR